jgi:hypothetical protein
MARWETRSWRPPRAHTATLLFCFFSCRFFAAPCGGAHAWPLLFNGDGSSLLTSGYGGDVLLSPDAGGAHRKRCVPSWGNKA